MINVIDAIMGTGKTSAAIKYMNDHPDSKFIYITPYLTETERIKQGCPRLHFVEPNNKLKEYDFKKTVHTAELIKEGRNISTTHQAFKNYDKDMLDDIKSQGYILIIDECIATLENFEFSPIDLKLAVKNGYAKENINGGIYTLGDVEYEGQALKPMMNLLSSREVVSFLDDDDKKTELHLWTLPPELIKAFKEVFILTYLFEGQNMCYFLKMYNIEYKYMGINRLQNGEYEFGNYPGYTPEYTYHIKDKIHILNNPKLNSIGDSRCALSMAWFRNDANNVKQLKNNIYNYFFNIQSDTPAEKKMWGTYNSCYNKLKGRGYTKAFVTFNSRATNEYKNRDCLAYITNIFMNVKEKLFYTKHGVQIDDDIYALSIMVQWIWRSAIREGKDINLYIPSRRMRHLLTDWINSLSEGGDAVA